MNNVNARRALAVVALICAIFSLAGIPTGAPMLAIAVILIAVCLLL